MSATSAERNPHCNQVFCLKKGRRKGNGKRKSREIYMFIFEEVFKYAEYNQALYNLNTTEYEH